MIINVPRSGIYTSLELKTLVDQNRPHEEAKVKTEPDFIHKKGIFFVQNSLYPNQHINSNNTIEPIVPIVKNTFNNSKIVLTKSFMLDDKFVPITKMIKHVPFKNDKAVDEMQLLKKGKNKTSSTARVGQRNVYNPITKRMNYVKKDPADKKKTGPQPKVRFLYLQ